MLKLRPVALLCLLFTIRLYAAPGAEFGAQGRAALMAGQYERAVELLEKAVAAEPNNAKHHYNLGAAYGEVGLRASIFKKASFGSKMRSELERSIELDPKYIEPRLALIDFYMVAPSIVGGSEDKAKEQALAIGKIDALQGHRALARVYSRQKKTDLARQEFVMGVRENPNSAKAHYYLGTFLIAEKNFTGGLQEVEAALKLDPSFMPSYFRLGVYAATSGNDYARGEQALKKYIAYTPAENEPQHSSAWYWLGQIYEKQGNKAEARKSYEQAHKLAPGSQDISDALKRVS